MQYGFVKTRAVTVNVQVADVAHNTQNIIAEINKAEKDGVMLLVFPELCICGYTCGDLFNQRALISSVEEGLKAIVQCTEGKKVLVFVGAPVVNCSKLYNCGIAIHGGKILGAVPKTYIPNYGEFYERRNFVSAESENTTIALCGQKGILFGKNVIFCAENLPEFKVACEICEDLWVPESPSVKHALAGANIIVNLSCSDETVGKAEYRSALVKMQSAKLVCGYVYCDSGAGESTTDMVFAGHDIICENGTVLSESLPFGGGVVTTEIDVEKLADERRRMSSVFYSVDAVKKYDVVKFETDCSEGEMSRVFPKLPFVPNNDEALSERTQLILNIQANGLAKRLRHTGARTAVVGISGGLDSALALLVIRRAYLLLDKPLNDIIAITMPGFGTTSRTFDNSVKLIKAVGASFRKISIADSVKQHFSDIGHDINVKDVTYENAQARMRTMILMDVANETGGMVVGTGDLSELALGWATYNGDHMSMYGVNCSVPKTLVKHLVYSESKRLGGELQQILADILATEISPELLPPDESGKIVQKTEDIIGPYELHDFFLYYAIRCGYTPEKILYIAKRTFDGAYDGKTVEKWLKNFYKRFFSQQFKRSCVPDGVKVGSLTLSPRGDWRMPSDARPAVWLI